MTPMHALVVRYASPFALHVIVSSVVLLVALAASYLPGLASRTRFALVAAGLAKFVLPGSLFAPLMNGERAAAVIDIAVPQGFVAAVRTAPPPPASPLDALALVAITVSAMLVAITFIAAFRAVSAALRSALPPVPREVAALNAARKRIGVRHAIDVVRSPISEAPAVLRVLRPLIVLPAGGADTLEDDELESLLCHECAHVARRDNLLALFAGVIRALFWFNPLVWLAHRRLAAEREKACDEIVANDAGRAETYAQALLKICQSILARPAAGVSCMASAHLKQRMEHIMRFNESTATKVRHFALTSCAALFLLGAVAATAAISSGKLTTDNDPYIVTMKAGRVGDGLYAVRVSAQDKSTNVVVWSSRPLKVKASDTFTANGATSVGKEPAIGFRATGSVAADGQVTADVEITRGDAIVQRTTVHTLPSNEGRYTGDPVTVNLEQADIRDVLKTFGQLTKIEIVTEEGVEGKVDVHFVNIPWDQALDEILHDHGYTWRMEGKKMIVSRM